MNFSQCLKIYIQLGQPNTNNSYYYLKPICSFTTDDDWYLFSTQQILQFFPTDYELANNYGESWKLFLIVSFIQSLVSLINYDDQSSYLQEIS